MKCFTSYFYNVLYFSIYFYFSVFSIIISQVPIFVSSFFFLIICFLSGKTLFSFFLTFVGVVVGAGGIDDGDYDDVDDGGGGVKREHQSMF